MIWTGIINLPLNDVTWFAWNPWSDHTASCIADILFTAVKSGRMVSWPLTVERLDVNSDFVSLSSSNRANGIFTNLLPHIATLVPSTVTPGQLTRISSQYTAQSALCVSRCSWSHHISALWQTWRHIWYCHESRSSQIKQPHRWRHLPRTTQSLAEASQTPEMNANVVATCSG